MIINSRPFIAYCTIVRKETKRVLRIWPQTLLPSAISMFLYFVIFGSLIGTRIGAMNGYDYIDYIMPGLLIMAVINNAFANVVSSFFSAKFQRQIEELLVAPIPNAIILLGFISGGVLRALLVAGIVAIIAGGFTQLQVHSWLLLITVLVLTAVIFSTGGLINGIFSRKFDDISIIPTFVLTPLTYLGGVFYSVDLLPDFWRNVSVFNPILYMVNAFRYAMLGASDIQPWRALILLFFLVCALFYFALHLLDRGVGLRK